MDDIKRKLDLIDRQLAGGPNLLQRTISTSPLVIAAAGLIAGILIQSALVESQATSHYSQIIWLWTTLLVTFATAAILIFAVRKSRIASCPATARAFAETSAPVLLSTCALICFASLGAIRLAHFYHVKPNDIRNLVGNEKGLATKDTEKGLKMDSRSFGYAQDKLRGNDKKINGSNGERSGNDENNKGNNNSADSAVKENDAKLATIRGLIVTEPYIRDNNDWKFARFQFTDPASSFYLKVGEVETVNGWAKATGTIRVQVDGPVLDLKAGDYVQIYCWLDKFGPPTNPGQFNTTKYLARKNVFIAASVPSREAIELLKKSSSTGTFIKIKRQMQEIAGQALRGNLDIDGQSYALLQALVLGYRTKIDSDTYKAFQETGLLHFLCLSGMNFMILFWIIWWLCKTAGLMKRAGAVICLAAAGLFLLVIPPQPPAFRAAVMCSVFCVSFFFRRKYNPFNALSLAAVILPLIKPTDLFDAGWQLSFAVVLGLLLFCVRIHFFLYEKITGLRWSKKAPKTAGLLFRVVPIAGPYLLRLFSTCLTAWLSGVGISLYHFYRINYLTSIWTVIVSPLIGVISVVGYVKIVLGLFLPSAAAMLDMVIRPLSDLLIWIVKLFAGLNISDVLIGKVSFAVIVLYYAFLLFAFFAYFCRPFVKKLICVTAVFVIMISLGAAKWHRTYRDNLVLTCLDVGHGQAILAQLPGRTNILFDAGSLQRANVGGRIIAPFLDYSGISKIDAIIISHKDIDHINGIPEVVEHCKTEHVYVSDAFFDGIDQWGPTKFLSDYLAEKGLKIERINDDLKPDSPASISVLWPNSQIPVEQLSDNDKSLVSLIQFGKARVLLCSDIEKFAQAQLLTLFPDLKADIIIVPHHGSRKTTEQRFIDNLDAGVLICSCGRSDYKNNRTIRPTNKARWLCTAEHGAVVVCINKEGMIK